MQLFLQGANNPILKAKRAGIYVGHGATTNNHPQVQLTVHGLSILVGNYYELLLLSPGKDDSSGADLITRVFLTTY